LYCMVRKGRKWRRKREGKVWKIEESNEVSEGMGRADIRNERMTKKGKNI
jgi:hypothetical protein